MVLEATAAITVSAKDSVENEGSRLIRGEDGLDVA
jgi:hypothetical protein